MDFSLITRIAHHRLGAYAGRLLLSTYDVMVEQTPQGLYIVDYTRRDPVGTEIHGRTSF